MTPPSSDSCNCCSAAKAHVIRRCRGVHKGRVVDPAPFDLSTMNGWTSSMSSAVMQIQRGILKECPFVSLIKYPFSGHNFIWCVRPVAIWPFDFCGILLEQQTPPHGLLILPGEISGLCGEGQLHAHLEHLRISAELAGLLFSYQ